MDHMSIHNDQWRNLSPTLYYAKISLRCIVYLNVIGKTAKYFEDKRKNLHDFKVGRCSQNRA